MHNLTAQDVTEKEKAKNFGTKKDTATPGLKFQCQRGFMEMDAGRRISGSEFTKHQGKNENSSLLNSEMKNGFSIRDQRKDWKTISFKRFCSSMNNVFGKMH